MYNSFLKAITSTIGMREYKTIDKYINTYILKSKGAHLTNQQIIDYIIFDNSNIIIDILQCKQNKPSKYDITIINRVVHFLNNKISTRYGNDYLMNILDLYKTRKVS